VSGLPSCAIDIVISNDTGSNVLGLFPSDLQWLGINEQNYAMFMGQSVIQTAAGPVSRTQLFIDMQVLKEDGTMVSECFTEDAIIVPSPNQPGDLQVRLSGGGMRNHLYFATAPDNATLFVACKKDGLVAQLPVV